VKQCNGCPCGAQIEALTAKHEAALASITDELVRTEAQRDAAREDLALTEREKRAAEKGQRRAYAQLCEVAAERDAARADADGWKASYDRVNLAALVRMGVEDDMEEQRDAAIAEREALRAQLATARADGVREGWKLAEDVAEIENWGDCPFIGWHEARKALVALLEPKP
jgi:hypothetical protein